MAVCLLSSPSLRHRTAKRNPVPRDVDAYVAYLCHQLQETDETRCQQRYPQVRISHNDFADVHAGMVAAALASYRPPKRAKQWTLRVVGCPRLTAHGRSVLIDAFLGGNGAGANATDAIEQDTGGFIGDMSPLTSLSTYPSHVAIEKRLVLDSIHLGDHDLQSLSRSLLRPGQSSLTELALERSHRTTEVDWDGFFRSISSLKLRSLDLTENDLDAVHVEALCRYIGQSNHHSLRSLTLASNPGIGDEGVSALCKSIIRCPNCQLVTVNLGDCNVGICGLQELCDCLEHANASLSRLHLYGNCECDQASFDVRSNVNYYLELNARGRALIRDETMAAKWSEVLSEQQSPRYLYGLLRDVPHTWVR